MFGNTDVRMSRMACEDPEPTPDRRKALLEMVEAQRGSFLAKLETLVDLRLAEDHCKNLLFGCKNEREKNVVRCSPLYRQWQQFLRDLHDFKEKEKREADAAELQRFGQYRRSREGN